MGIFSSIKKNISSGIGGIATGGLLDNKTAMSFIPGIGDAMATEEANKANAKFAQAQMDFQERMSNTAYQRAMDDMKKAGLNPMLAFSQGGASTPSGASATASPVTRSKLAEFGMSAAAGVAGIKNQAALTDNTLKDSEAGRANMQSQTAKNIADAQRTQVETQIRKKEIPGSEMKESAMKKAANVVSRVIENVENSANSLYKGYQSMKKREEAQQKKIKVLGPSNQPPVKSNKE